MAHRKLSTVLAALTRCLDQTERLAVAAERWSRAAADFPRGVPKFTMRHKDMVTELAFLQAFLAWEAFLEESFVLYLWGKKPPRGNPPRCRYYASPRTRELTEQLLVPEGRKYADWSSVQNVTRRAERFFENGEPYCQVLRSQQSKLEGIEAIRNAIAHASTYSWRRFQELVRDELATYPPNLTIGRFLAITVPGSSPPESFLEHYLSYIRFAAGEIVPT